MKSGTVMDMRREATRCGCYSGWVGGLVVESRVAQSPPAWWRGSMRPACCSCLAMVLVVAAPTMEVEDQDDEIGGNITGKCHSRDGGL